MPKNVNFIVDCGTYPFDILCCFGGGKKKLLTVLGKHFPKKNLGTIRSHELKRGLTHHFEGGQTLLWLEMVPECPKDYGYLAHEIYHCASIILDRVGIPHTAPTDEAYAYLIQYITERILEKLATS